MATWSDVGRLALALPETTEGTSYGNRAWKVKDKAFVWERPLRRSDLEALGDAAPRGHVLGVHVADLDTKEALLATRAEVCFTTPHFDGYAAVLVRLDEITVGELKGLIADAWQARASAKRAPAKRATAPKPRRR